MILFDCWNHTAQHKFDISLAGHWEHGAHFLKLKLKVNACALKIIRDAGKAFVTRLLLQTLLDVAIRRWIDGLGYLYRLA